MSQESIVDASRPNAGRIYDYFLGGHHNFEVDRQVAEQLIELAPFIPKVARLHRWCLQDVARELTEVLGYDIVIDFASGLPTVDHLHTAVKPGTTVIYSDYDPVVVEYAQEILSDTPNVYYFEADARQPEELLKRPIVQKILDGRRDVALAHWGVASYMTDEEITHAAQSLYDWTGNRACWTFHAQGADANPDDPASARILRIYEKMGTPVRARPLETYQSLIKPWQADERGFISLLEWHGFDPSELMTEDDFRLVGAAGGAYAAYLIK